MWNGIYAILICISLMTNSVEYFLVYLLTIYISFLVKCLLKTFAIKQNCFYHWVVGYFLKNLEIVNIKSIFRHVYQEYFLLAWGCLFIFLMVILEAFDFDQVYFFFSYYGEYFLCPKKSLPALRTESYFSFWKIHFILIALYSLAFMFQCKFTLN